MSGMPIPNMMDSLDFVKKLWSGMGIPNAVTPTTDLNELDKRIADLRTVEQWLQLNLTLLRTSIQGLEVQRGTIATLKAFSNNLSSSFGAPPTAAATAGPAAPPMSEPGTPAGAPMSSFMQPMVDAGLTPTAWWNLLSTQFNKIAQATAQSQEPVPTPERKETPKEAAPPAPDSPKAAPKKRARP